MPPDQLGGENWSNLGSSFEGKEQNFVFAISINPTPGFAGKDVLLDPAVKEANRKIETEVQKPSPPIFGDAPPHSPPTRQSAVMTRLSNLYLDDNYGPEYFRQNARLIKHLMLVYKTCKTNPNLGMFFLKGSKTGIHIHFNSVSRKKQLVIPIGSPDMEPIRVNIGQLRTWYKAQRRKAINARLKAQLEIMELKLALSHAKTAMNAASCSLDNVLVQFERYLETCLSKETEKEETRSEEARTRSAEVADGGRIGVVNGDVAGEDIVANLASWATHCWDPRASEIKTRKSELSLKTDELAKLHDDQGMYEEKDFLKLMLDGLMTVTEKFSSLAKLVKEVYDGLVKCDKQIEVKSLRIGDYNLRTRKIVAKLDKVS